MDKAIHGRNNNWTPERGFQHLYTSKSMATSLQVHAAFIKATKVMTSGAPTNRSSKKRSVKKRKKMDTLQLVSLSEMHSMERRLLESTKVFFSGTTKRMLQITIMNSLNLSAIVDLKVVDTKESVRME
jgi:hypothetical protein